MAGLDCAETLCTKCITNGCISFSEDDFGNLGTPPDLYGTGSWELPPLESFQRVPVITEAPDIRLGGTQGTSGLFTNACADTRREDWLVTVSTCDANELECFLQHGDCWRFRWHQDCALAHITGDKGYDMEVGQVSFDQNWNFSNNTTDPVLLAFTITGLTVTNPFGFTCPVAAAQCDATDEDRPIWLQAANTLGNSCAA